MFVRAPLPSGIPAHRWDIELSALDDKIDFVVRIAFAILITAFAGVMLNGVFFRYALGNSLAWSDELALITFVWAMCLAISSAYLHDKHIRLDLLVDRLTLRWKERTGVLAEGVALGFLLCVLSSGYAALSLTARAHTEALGLPQTLPFAAIPIAAALMLFHWVRRNRVFGATKSQTVAKIAVGLLVVAIVVTPLGIFVQASGATRTLLLLVMMFGPMLIGVPVAFCLGFATMMYFAANGDVPLETNALQMFFGINNLTLVAIPLLILSGRLLHSCGIANRIVDFAQVLVGRIRGGLGQTNIVASFIFGDISGSAVADTAAIGSVMIPQMKARGYRADFCAALQGAAGTLGMMAPLSITVLLYSAAVNTSVGRLAAASIIPALFVAGSFMLVAFLHARRWRYPKEATPRSEIIPRTIGALPGLSALAVVLVGVLGGIASPAEVGSLLLAYVLLLAAFLYRTASLGELFDCLVDAGHVSGMTLLIVATSAVLGFALSRDLVGLQIASFVSDFSTNKYFIIFLVSAVFIVLGMVLEGPAMIFGFLPSFMPLLINVGVDPIHWGALFLVNMGLGAIIPPVALNLFISTKLAGTTYGDAVRASVPFIIIMFADMVLLAVFPSVALFLPSVFFK